MSELLTIYQQNSSINCAEIVDIMVMNKRSCFLDNGFCQILESASDKFSLDRAMNTHGFPRTTQQKTLSTSPILDTIVHIDNHYYQTTAFQKRFVGTLAEVCHKMGLRSTPDLYNVRASDRCEQGDCMIKMDALNP